METGFTVYDDFFSYKSGIYKYNGTAKESGGHAVKLIGWGNQNGENYWIAANSWGSGWGENGYFRIAFGQCGIDDQTLAGDPE